MLALLNSVIGIAFLGIAIVLTLLMFYLWKFPYDKTTHRSTAPRALVIFHRLLGYVYVLIYLYLMWQMVPRLWAYQIELPARSVFHLTLGMSIGAILMIKITIVRFFRHLEAKLVPFLGTGLLVCTMLLIFLALPFSLREAYLSATALDGDGAMTMERIERVREQLPKAGIEAPEVIERLASRESLDRGRTVLMNKCTQCHDLRTALARPRTPDGWRQTVARMANRSTILNPISEQDQLEVTAYLIAISPTLQKTLMQRRQQAMETAKSQQAGILMVGQMKNRDDMAFDPVAARALFENRCSQCHTFTQIELAPPTDRQTTIDLVRRMIGNGLIISEEEGVQIIQHILETYVEEEEGEGEGEGNEEKEETSPADKEITGKPESQLRESTADRPLEGEALFTQYHCLGCHGPGGSDPIAPNYPKLTGLSKKYLSGQIKDIRDGRRINGLSAVMRGGIVAITDEEIEAIAEYLAN